MDVNWLLIVLILIVAWIFVYYIAITVLRNNVSPYGPALLIKTQAGIKIIERVSKWKFWDYFISFFYYAMPVLSAATVVLLIYEAVLVFSIPRSAAIPLSYALALPGINPTIPIGYGIISLVVAIALHEGAHGVAARRHNIKVRSTGLLWLIIPVGAFVEPDEEETKKVEPKVRGKIFAAGPGMNIVLAVIFIVLAIGIASTFTAVQGAPVQSSATSMFHPGDIIEKVNGISIHNPSEIPNLALTPGTYVNVTLLRSGHALNERVIYGLYIVGVLSGYPAAEAGIKSGDVITAIGNDSISNETVLQTVLSNYKAGDVATIKIFNGSAFNNYNITFASDYNYLKSQGVSNPGVPKDYPFIGIQVAMFGVTLFDQYSYLSLLKDPLYGGALGFFEYVGLPFHFLLPLPSYLLPTIITNPVTLNLEYLFYWLFWLNFALGLTNILPLVPLDGGYVLMNTPALQKSKRTRDAIVAAVSLIVLFLLLWEIIFPRI
ncbi:MAG: site-2 protease family protein [Thermoplasmatales archaeon]